MRPLLGLVFLCGGCVLYLGGGDDNPPPPCLYGAIEPAPLMLIDPSSLSCETIYPPPPCDGTCGPCPGVAAPPSWGWCTSACRDLDEQACGTTTGCRVARDWATYYENRPSFLGCYPTDMNPIIAERCEGLDAWGCSRDDSCAALYEPTPNDCATCPQEAFKECIPETQHAGSCALATCRAVGPTCPSGTTPGIENGCYTGACIPTQFCAPGV